MHSRLLIVPLLSTLAFTGCESTSTTPARPVYTAGQTGTMITQESGTIMSVEEVLIQAPSSSSNTGTGAQMGGAVGRAAMTGNPMAIAGAMGNIMGSKAGATLDNRVGDKITILTDNGKTVTIVQARDAKAPLMPNERVVIEVGGGASQLGGGTTRVVRETGSTKNELIGAAPTTPTKRVW